jgi:hypothetical protein
MVGAQPLIQAGIARQFTPFQKLYDELSIL